MTAVGYNGVCFVDESIAL